MVLFPGSPGGLIGATKAVHPDYTTYGNLEYTVMIIYRTLNGK